MIKLKPSTVSDTDIKKNSRWFRAGSSQRGEIDQILDLYWGGPERRITGLTLKIIGLNVIALVILLVGVFSLGQYQKIIIESKLKLFETEIFLVSAALSQGEMQDAGKEGRPLDSNHLASVSKMIRTLSGTLDKRLIVFDANGHRIADSDRIKDGKAPAFRLLKAEDDNSFVGAELLKNVARLIFEFVPRPDNLQQFNDTKSAFARDYVDANIAMQGNVSLNAWRSSGRNIILTAAMPIVSEDQHLGVVMLFSNGDEIKKSIEDAWFDIFKIFLVTFGITVFLSIYLSGVIAKPLRRLAKAAEKVRRGQADYRDIPDMSGRKDEIGELSIVLRDMTYALWERMDSIEAFAADVAHEIKNPLTSLRSAVETAQIVKKKEDLQKLLSVIQHDVERLDRLITDISHASRLDAELSRENFGPVDIKRLLRGLINVYKDPLDRDPQSKKNEDVAVKNDVTLRLYMPEKQDIFVTGSETRLMQVFQNIVANALSFSPPKTTILIAMESSPHRITLFFEDEGPGIPENKLKTIFERFYSERPGHEAFGRHSGLGLSICKQIIAAHNGVVFAENRIDHAGKVKGARFVVILNTI